MKSQPIFFCVCIVLLFSGCGGISTKPQTTETGFRRPAAGALETLRADIDDILQGTLFTTADIGIKVVSVETGEVLYERNAYKLHHPASTTKLFTAATALLKLGATHRFETTLSVDADADTERVARNIYLKGGADPVLQSLDIVRLADALLETGLSVIQGDIVVDETYLDTVREGPGWMWDDRPLRISALSIRRLDPDPVTQSRAIACGYLLRNELIEKGVQVTGGVIAGTVPADAQQVAVHRSPPLADILKRMNKPSDNWIAEMIFKAIGAEAIGEPGTWRKGRTAIAAFLEETLADPPAHRFVDGSGLSRYNLLNAELLTRLLVSMYQDFEVMPEFLASLAVAGVDGTLRTRMQGMYAERVLRAKTGTLSGVSALAGYTVTAEDEVLAFGILIIHYVRPPVQARDVQDKIGSYLTGFRRTPIPAAGTPIQSAE